MAGLIYHTDKRRVLPQLERATTYRDTIALPNLHDSSSVKYFQPLINLTDENIQDKLVEWRKSKTLNLAGEILSRAILTGDAMLFNEITGHLLIKFPHDEVFKWLTSSQNVNFSIEERIKRNHAKLLIEPGDPLTWTDQAINYTIQNNREDAIKSIEFALSLDSNMGYIVRNASRIFNLTGDNGRAIKLLKNSVYYRHDPQILSAEIAFSELERRKTQGLSIAEKLLENSRYNHYEKSELASTLGTIEYFKDNFKKSEDLFDLSLIKPNKNSFAQSLWYKRQEISPIQFEQYQNSNEIQTHRYSKANDFENALKHSLLWIAEEPYSARPYRVSSYITGVIFGDNEEAFQLIKSGKESQQLIKGDNYSYREQIEFNNDMAYHLLKAEKIAEAEIYLESLLNLDNSNRKLHDFEQISVATLGLYAYKMKELTIARKLYRRTIDNFRESGKDYLANSAFLNFFEEEVAICNDINELENLRRELDERIPDDVNKNELNIRKSNALKLFHRAVIRVNQGASNG